jgi:hypothetical protein
MASTQEELISKITKELENDAKVKVAAVDIDGVLRGKVMQKSKFFSILKDGFGKPVRVDNLGNFTLNIDPYMYRLIKDFARSYLDGIYMTRCI